MAALLQELKFLLRNYCNQFNHEPTNEINICDPIIFLLFSTELTMKIFKNINACKLFDLVRSTTFCCVFIVYFEILSQLLIGSPAPNRASPLQVNKKNLHQLNHAYMTNIVDVHLIKYRINFEFIIFYTKILIGFWKFIFFYIKKN